jgi:O-glycosyl hydrolase
VGRYELTAAQAALTMKPDVASSADNAWQLSLPAQSVSVFVPKK